MNKAFRVFPALLRISLGCLLMAGCAAGASDQRALEEELSRALARADVTTPGVIATSPHAEGPARLETIVPPAALRGAQGLACWQRRVFVAQPLADRISEVHPDGSVSALASPPELEDPSDIAFDEAGTLLVASGRSGEVWRRPSEGRWERLAADVPDVSGLAPLPSGKGLLLSQCSGTGRVILLDGGSRRDLAGGLGCPVGPVVVNGAALVAVPSRGEIVALDLRGTRRAVVSGLGSPSAVGIAPDGRLLVLESRSGEIRRLSFDPESFSLRLDDVVFRLDPGLADFVTCGETLIVSNGTTNALYAFKPWPGPPRTLVPGGLTSPTGLAFEGADLLVADGAAIKRIHGGRIDVILRAGVNGLPSPVGLAVGAPGLAWVTAPSEGEVLQVDLSRGEVSTIASALDWPTSVMRALDGQLIVAETGAGRVLRIGTDGIPQTIGSYLISPVGLGLRGDRILVAEPEGGRVLAIQEDEAPAIVATGLSGPNGLALDAAGRLYISEQQTGRILRRSSGGTIRTIATGLALGTGSTDHPLPIPMTLDADGSIVVASPETGAVVRIVPE